MASVENNDAKSYSSIQTYLKRAFKKVKPDSQIKQDSIKVFDKIYYSMLDNISKFIHDIIKQNGLNTVTNDHLMTIFITDFFPEDFKEQIKEQVITSVEMFRNYQEEKAAGTIEKTLNRTQQAGLIFPIPKTEKYVITKVTELIGKKHRFDQKGGFFVTVTAIIQHLMEMLIIKSSEYTKDNYSKIQVSPKFLCETIETEKHFECLYGKHTYTDTDKTSKKSKKKPKKDSTEDVSSLSDEDMTSSDNDSVEEKKVSIKKKKTTVKKKETSDKKKETPDKKKSELNETKKKPAVKKKMASKKKKACSSSDSGSDIDNTIIKMKKITIDKNNNTSDINQTIFNDSEEYSDVDSD